MTSALNIEQIRAGQELPPLNIDITPKLIVGGALASRDFQEVHHDKAQAEALGTPDIFMNILTTNGLVGRYVTDWTGTGALLKKVSIKLGVPNYPGDTMLLRGEVVSIDAENRRVEVVVRGDNKIGNHVTGNITVQFSGEG